MIVVPKSNTNQLITEVHGNVMYGHEGQFKTKERILQSYWWPGMDQHINQHLREPIIITSQKISSIQKVI